MQATKAISQKDQNICPQNIFWTCTSHALVVFFKAHMNSIWFCLQPDLFTLWGVSVVLDDTTATEGQERQHIIVYEDDM